MFNGLVNPALRTFVCTHARIHGMAWQEAVKKDSLRWQIVVITMVSVVAAMAAGQLMTWIHYRHTTPHNAALSQHSTRMAQPA